MIYNSKTIKKYKGKLICISYRASGRGYFNRIHEITGEITASTKYTVIFNVNKAGHEIPINYPQIINIKNPEK